MVYSINYLIFIFVIGVLILASITDIKKREVPDSISYVLIAGSSLLVLAYSISNNTISNLVYMPLSILLVTGFSYFMYKVGQWGGGDVKILLGISIVFTSINLFSNRSFIALFINILLFGGIYGILGTIAVGVIKIKKLKNHFKAYDIPFFIVTLLTMGLSLFFIPVPLNFFISIAAFMLFSMRFVFLVASYLMYIIQNVNKLTEGDWLAESPKDSKGKKIVPERDTGLTAADIEKLKSSKVKEVLIKIGLPFIPGILFAVAITMLFGNPLLQIISSLYI